MRRATQLSLLLSGAILLPRCMAQGGLEAANPGSAAAPADPGASGSAEAGAAGTSAAAGAPPGAGAGSASTPEPTPRSPSACVPFAAAAAIVSGRCALGGCHLGPQAAIGMDLSPAQLRANTVGVASTEVPGRLRISPGAPEASVLYLKLTPTPPSGARMPLGGSLDAASIQTIRDWIQQGALADGQPCPTPTGTTAPQRQAPVQRIEIEGGATMLPRGDIAALSAVGFDAHGDRLDAVPFTWRTAAEDVLYVDGQGRILGLSTGTTEVFASAGGVQSAPFSVTVTAATPPPAHLAKDVAPIFHANCVRAGCHAAGGQEPTLALTGADLVHHLSGHYVTPYRPGDSFLFQKLSLSQPEGARMPLGGGQLNTPAVQAIFRWILAGAQND